MEGCARMSKDHPIIFSAAMILALLSGRKTQTRRLAWREKECPGGAINDGGGQMDYVAPSVVRTPSPWRKVQPGDRLWVRESFHQWIGGGPYGESDVMLYRATTDEAGGPWRPSIHMPRWASRLTLTVTDVRVQRVQEISEAGARAEGATHRPACNGFQSRYDGWCMDWSRVGEMSRWARRRQDSPAKVPLTESDVSLSRPSMAFASYWNELHGPDAWEANPEVVALTFTVEQRNICAISKDTT
jgi:hypothetical protein